MTWLSDNWRLRDKVQLSSHYSIIDLPNHIGYYILAVYEVSAVSLDHITALWSDTEFESNLLCFFLEMLVSLKNVSGIIMWPALRIRGLKLNIGQTKKKHSWNTPMWAVLSSLWAFVIHKPLQDSTARMMTTIYLKYNGGTLQPPTYWS